jgi:quinol-cytochrome oxidoreductase complex cytochrome b subunit
MIDYYSLLNKETIILQIITGIFLGLHYTSDLNSAYSSVFFFIREIYYGWCLRYLHSSGASFVFLFLFLHLGRAISYGSYFYNPNTWFSGILLFFFLMATAFLGYVLPFGQMSFWGATVITNLLSPFPCLIEWVCGGHYVYNPTLKRFFLFHFVFPFLLCGFFILHLFYLHFLLIHNKEHAWRDREPEESTHHQLWINNYILHASFLSYKRKRPTALLFSLSRDSSTIKRFVTVLSSYPQVYLHFLLDFL